MAICFQCSEKCKMNEKVSENVKIKVFESFGRTEKQVENDVKIVTEWLQTQPHLPEIMNEARIRNFLLLNKFSIEKTKKKIDCYYTIRSVPGWFDNANPNAPIMKEAMQNVLTGVSRKLVDGVYCPIFLKNLHVGGYAPKEMHLHFFNILEARLEEDFMAGDILVLDCENFNLEDYAKNTPSLILKSITIYQKVFSMRLKAAYLINTIPAISMVMSVLKATLKAKLFERIHVLKNISTLKEIFSEDILPADYGGKGPSIQELNDLTLAKIAQYKDRYDQLDQLRVDEKLRPEKLENDEFLGFYGNFKKLDID